MTNEEIGIISERINGQDGRKYPCSNQVVVCGFFSTEEKWNRFVQDNKNCIQEQRKREIKLSNNERWCYFDMNSFLFKGYRFYKIKVDKDINREVFYKCIYPCCSLYCKEIEWI